jgi:hypothetical protein
MIRRCSWAQKAREEQVEEDMTGLSERPGGAIEDLMVTPEVRVILVPHLPQRSGHGSAATGEERPNQEDQDSLPGPFLKTTTKGDQPRHEHRGQGHRTPPEVIFSSLV